MSARELVLVKIRSKEVKAGAFWRQHELVTRLAFARFLNFEWRLQVVAAPQGRDKMIQRAMLIGRVCNGMFRVCVCCQLSDVICSLTSATSLKNR